MLLKLIAFELKYHAKQWVFRIAVLGFLLFGIAMGSSPAPFGHGVFANSPFGVNYYIGMLSLGTGIVIALLAGGAILRDDEYRFGPLLFTTNMTKFQYVISRFAGLFAVTAFAFAFAILGLLLGSALPMVDPDTLGPVNPGAYLWGYVVLGIPNMLLGAVVIFAVGALSRSALTTFMSGIFLYVLYFLGAVLGNSPLMATSGDAGGSQVLPLLLDPYGLVAYLTQTQAWTAQAKNTLLPPLTGGFLLNRLAVIGLAMGLFAWTYGRFSFRQPANRKAKPERIVKETATAMSFRAVKPAAPGFARAWRGFCSQTWMNFQVVIKGFPYYALLAMWVFLMAANLGTQLLRGDYDTPFYPLTGILLPGIILPMTILGALAVVFYAAELAWLERRTGFAPIVDATPAANAVFWAAKVAGLAILISGLIAISILIGMGFQVFHGFFQFDFGLYLSLFVTAGAPLILFGVLALFIQAVLGNKYSGMAAGFVAMVLLFTPLLDALGFQHPLYRYAYTPEYIYSPMAGASYHGGALGWYLVYWSAFAGVLGIATLRFWRRGLRTSVLAHRSKTVAWACLAVFLVSGAVVFYRTNIANPYLTKAKRLAWQEAYERQYRPLAGQPTPVPVSLEMKLGIFPGKRMAEFEGELVMVNRSDAPIESVLIGANPEARDLQFSLEGTTKEEDERLGQFHFAFNQPLAPGEKCALAFSFWMRKSAFHEMDPDVFILKHAAYIDLAKVLPSVGYDPALQIQSARARRKHGLEALADEPVASVRAPLDIHMVVSTSKEQTVVAQGIQEKTWQAEGRSFFQFHAGNARPDWFGIASAKYRKETVAMGSRHLDIYHHPDHAFNIGSMVAAGTQAHRYFQQYYGDDPRQDLVLAEIPLFAKKFRVNAYPRTFFASEDGIFLFNLKQKRPDLAFRGVVHKLAHQWWDRDPALMERESLLTELLAMYTEMVVNESHFGLESTLAYLRQFERRYFRFRSVMSWVEAPIIQAQDQPYIYRYKGPHVVYALRDAVGEAEVNAMLRQFLMNDLGQVSADDIIRGLLARTTLENRIRVKELLSEVVTYDLALDSITRGGQDAPSDISLAIQGRRIYLDQDGERHTGPVGGWVEIGLYRGGTQVQLEKVYLDAESQTVTISALPEVDAAVIDPRRLRLEANHRDNRKSIPPAQNPEN